MSLNYHVINKKVQLPPPSMADEGGIPIYPTAKVFTPAKYHITLLKSIQLAISNGNSATIYSAINASPREPLVCPGVPDLVYLDKKVLLVRNHTFKPLVANLKVPITYLNLISAEDIAVYWTCGLMRDPGLPKTDIYVAPPLNSNLPPADHAKAMALLKGYINLFSVSPHNFRLIKGISRHLNLEDNCPFRSQPYLKSKVKDVHLLIELKKLLNLAYYSPLKAPGSCPCFSYARRTKVIR